MFSLTTILVLISVALFIVGLTVGWIYSGDPEMSTKSKIRTGITIAVTLMWVASVITEILVVGYTVSPLVHAIMGAIVGYFFTEEGLTFQLGGDK